METVEVPPEVVDGAVKLAEGDDDADVWLDVADRTKDVSGALNNANPPIEATAITATVPIVTSTF